MNTKTHIVVKVSSEGCPICEHMSRHDRATFEGFPELHYQELDLDAIIDERDRPLEGALFKAIEGNALNPDYTVDTPLYLFLTSGGKYLGHHSGAATIVELRSVTQEILQGSS